MYEHSHDRHGYADDAPHHETDEPIDTTHEHTPQTSYPASRLPARHLAARPALGLVGVDHIRERAQLFLFR